MLHTALPADLQADPPNPNMDELHEASNIAGSLDAFREQIAGQAWWSLLVLAVLVAFCYRVWRKKWPKLSKPSFALRLAALAASAFAEIGTYKFSIAQAENIYYSRLATIALLLASLIIWDIRRLWRDIKPSWRSEMMTALMALFVIVHTLQVFLLIEPKSDPDGDLNNFEIVNFLHEVAEIVVIAEFVILMTIIVLVWLKKHATSLLRRFKKLARRFRGNKNNQQAPTPTQTEPQPSDNDNFDTALMAMTAAVAKACKAGEDPGTSRYLGLQAFHDTYRGPALTGELRATRDAELDTQMAISYPQQQQRQSGESGRSRGNPSVKRGGSRGGSGGRGGRPNGGNSGGGNPTSTTP